MKFFESAEGDFQLRYPASWEIAPNGADFKFHARGVLGLVNANVVTEQLQPGTTLDDFVDKSLAQFKNMAGVELRAPVKRAIVTVNGTRAVRLEIVARIPSTHVLNDMHFDTLVAVVDARGYVPTCTTGAGAAATMKPVFDGIINSMRFTK